MTQIQLPHKIKIHLQKLSDSKAQSAVATDDDGSGARRRMQAGVQGPACALHHPACALGEGVPGRPGPEALVALRAERAPSSLVVPGIVSVGLQHAAESSGSFQILPQDSYAKE